PIPTYYGDEICRVNGLRYAFNVIKASLQARFQKFHIFYDRRFDCAPPEDKFRYRSILDFESSQPRVVELIDQGARVLELSSGICAIGPALKKKKRCVVVGCGSEANPLMRELDKYLVADLNNGLPDIRNETFDYIVASEVVEHLDCPEDFLDQ